MQRFLNQDSAPSAPPPLCGKIARPKSLFIPLALSLLLIAGNAHAVSIHASADPVKDEPPIKAQDKEHWAFKPLPKAAAPARSLDWQPASHELDALVKTNAAPADPATLIRRLTFDLTGLPPTPEEVTAFKDSALQTPNSALESLVDKLLSSPRYGEHWAQWWLDLARYADTDGFEYDAERNRAWHYRDWVIDALNRDMPFDAFVQHQIAGDLMGDETATGFLFSCPDMPDLNNQNERRHVILNDIATTVGAVGLGLTVGCAQCHDHPHDPISQADFYRLRAFFDNTVLTKTSKPLGPAVRIYTEGIPASTVFVRGDFKRPGPEIQPAFPRVFGATPAKADRTALAQWLASKDNALFLRTMANRLWQQHFGKPLAAIPGDLGHQGEAPNNPALLDWLAAELPRQNWSLKRLHKVIVMSQTYQQKLPAPTRLTGEMLRDAMLSVSGQLNLKTGGPGVKLPLPKEISSTLLKNQSEPTKDVSEHTRRSIYTFARRNLRHPLFELFDRPDAQISCARRNASTTAPQALMLLNSDFAHSIATKIATQLNEQHGSDATALITAATLRCLSRPPTAQEIAGGQKFLQKQTALTPGFREALADYCLALLNSNEFVYVD
ncbi:DUF1549 and DUF1553 domain-containing protein [Prosthecobacter sp.]|uniref:DUF1549 and DUF1553 domain-containing protein n=1 Tax=Prosthecobacter sp. TaxID=1965333 RepID=UPI00248A7D65|nr:DUF1549 and DUF1553 domain-containing protein [Prosthecobacter sp.]MDI1312026.1 DUF1549 and DUF1553 domain-containing protein [Prosthecobacter sp.]